MIGFILLLIGIFIAGIPVGITAIVHSARVKGKPKAFLLPLSIVALVVTIFTFGYAFVPDSSTTAKTVLYLSALAVSITTLSVAVHAFPVQPHCSRSTRACGTERSRHSRSYRHLRHLHSSH